MKRFKILAATIATAAIAAQATAQISNTVYFDKYNWRQHHLNPAMMPDQKVYFSIAGNIAMDFGNNSLAFDDIIKNVDGRTVLFLDKAANAAPQKKGQTEFLDAINKKFHIFANAYIDILDLGFKIGDKNFVGLSVGARVGTNTMIPKKFFEVFLDGMKEDETFDLEAGDVYFNAFAYSEIGLTFTRQVNDRLSLGVTGKYLKGFGNIKTDFDQLTLKGSIDEWTLSGKAEMMAYFPGIRAYKDEEGELHLKNDKEDDLQYKDFKGSNGLAIDLGGTYRLTDRLTLAASIKDLGFIRHKKNVASVYLEDNFTYTGGTFESDDNRDQFGQKQNGEIKFDQYEKDFKKSFGPDSKTKYAQFLNTNLYAGASYDLIKQISVGFLSKTTFAHKKVWEEISISANIHPIRIISINGIYSMMNGSWNALGLGANLNLGPINIFAACDNIPLHYGKDTSNDIIFPDRLKSTRFNFGLGLVFGSKEKKDKKNKQEESILDNSWRTDTPEPDFFDADGDGIEDQNDQCPDTDPAAQVDNNGCPLDTDTDGVPDYLDKCPGTPAGASIDENGCPTDSDADGVPDYLDKCPDTPSSTKADATGCPIDTDNDGIPDYMDKCPEIAGVAANNGCPEIKQEAKQIFRKALNGIQFATGQSTILKTSYKILDDIAKIMNDNPDYKLFIKGHTDSDGNADMNLQLSKDRAEAVLKYLAGKGIPESRMHSEGYGQEQPLVPNNSAANKAKNRRVEFEVEF